MNEKSKDGSDIVDTNIKKIETNIDKSEKGKCVFISSKLSNVRISQFKVRKVADVVRRMGAVEAESVLRCMTQKGSFFLRKAILSAISNAKHNNNINALDLKIESIEINQAAKFKRYKHRARGSTYPIHKKNAHIKVVLSGLKGENDGTEI